MGKSGCIAKKIAATLASTGTPALFPHPAEGVHCDLGMVVRGDAVIAISNSGETEELIQLLPAFKRLGVRLGSLVGNPQSTLARESEDFALLHPGGRLGRKLLLKVGDLMHRGEELPLVDQAVSMREAIPIISGKRLGMTGVTDGEGRLVGIITDGDLRRALQRWPDLLEREVRTVMTPDPKCFARSHLAARAVQIMEQHAITSLLIVDETGRPEGVIHLHDLLRAGVV